MSEVQAQALEVQEIFGKFGVLVGGEVQIFETDIEAQEFAAVKGSEEASYQRAAVYARGLGLEEGTKNFKSKTNAITSFLAYEAKGCPDYVAPVIEAPADVEGLEA